MKEQELKELWWWKNADSWKRLAETTYENIGSGGAKVTKATYERAAFMYELQARVKPWKRKPKWPNEKPFFRLTATQAASFYGKYPRKGWGRIFRNGVFQSQSAALSANHTISLDGLAVMPGTTTRNIFRHDILKIVEERMKLAGLKWKRSVLKGDRIIPYPWGTLENLDRKYFGFLSPKLAEHPEKAIALMRKRYIPQIKTQ